MIKKKGCIPQSMMGGQLRELEHLLMAPGDTVAI